MRDLTLVALGDIILGDASQQYVDVVKPVLLSADLRLGQLEVPYTERSEALSGLSREPFRLEPLQGCMDILTTSGNHLYDAGDAGIEDTLAWLDAHGILHTGSGMNLEEARRPAIFEKDGVRFGVLNYNCTGPKATHASETKPGGAYVRVHTSYSLGDVANPGGAPDETETFLEGKSLEWMCSDIRALREQCDVLAVYFHKGIVHKPIKLADYETAIAHIAVEMGADVIFSSHSHILHGIEVFKGKTIYHGLGNGIAWVPSLSPNYQFRNAGRNEVFDPKAWAEKRIERFGFVPDPDYPSYPFHPDAIYTIFAKCIVSGGQITETRCIPAIVNKAGMPIVVGRDNGGERVMDYLREITEKAGLNAQYTWAQDEIVIH